MIGKTVRTLSIAGAAFAVLATATPALPQDTDAETRIRRLEAEVRALQRRVFPGGDGRYFEPEITAQPTARPTVDTSSTTAVTDILARLDALEAQLQNQTAQIEENSNALRLLSERLQAIETDPIASAQPVDSGSSSSSASTNARPALTQATASERPGPSDERLAAVREIAKPQTDDPGDDEYSYGFRLWDAGFYPEAQQQLTMFVEEYPGHWRVTYGRNLLGRTYLDDGMAREAAPWFLKNYQDDRTGARAGDSLLYLAKSMIALDDTNRACIALAEFSETYPALASGRLRSEYDAARSEVSCN